MVDDPIGPVDQPPNGCDREKGRGPNETLPCAGKNEFRQDHGRNRPVHGIYSTTQCTKKNARSPRSTFFTAVRRTGYFRPYSIQASTLKLVTTRINSTITTAKPAVIAPSTAATVR